MKSTLKKSCTELASTYTEFGKSEEDPDENCINCILDDILSMPEGELREASIELFRKGLMQLNCARTGKSYMVTQEFFNRIFKSAH